MASIGRVTTAPTVEAQALANRFLVHAVKKINLDFVKMSIKEHANPQVGIYVALEKSCNYSFTAFVFPTKDGALVQSCEEALTKLHSIIAFLATNYPFGELPIPQGDEIGLQDKLDRGLKTLNCELVKETIDAGVDMQYAYEQVLLARLKWINNALIFQKDKDLFAAKKCCNNYKTLAPLFKSIKKKSMEKREMQAKLLDSRFSSSSSSSSSSYSSSSSSSSRASISSSSSSASTTAV